MPLIAAGALLVLVGYAGATGRLPRNWVIGIRTPRALSSDEEWYRVHREGAPALVVGGIACALLGVLSLLVPSYGTALALSGAGVLLVSVVAAAIGPRRR